MSLLSEDNSESDSATQEEHSAETDNVNDSDDSEKGPKKSMEKIIANRFKNSCNEANGTADEETKDGAKEKEKNENDEKMKEDPDDENAEYEYLVKWKNLACIHCEWVE